jgi:hypothetical protein
VRHAYIFIDMDTFDLKLFLVENKLTETSRLNEIKVVPGKIGKRYYGVFNIDGRGNEYDGHPMYIITNSKQTMVDKLNLSDPNIYPKYTLNDMRDSYSDGEKLDTIIYDDWAMVTDDISIFNKLLDIVKRGGNSREPKKF